MNLSKEEVYNLIMEDPEVRGKKACFLPGLFNEEDLPTWSEFINHLSDSVTREEDLARKQGLQSFETMYGGTITKGRYYSMSAITDDDTDKAQRFKGLMPLEEMLNEYHHHPKKYISDAFVSFITGDDYAYQHTDVYTHNLFVNCQGQVRWNIYEALNSDEPTETYLLNPGDVIFVRADVAHEVAVPTPRASVVFRIDTESGPHYDS